MMRRAVRTDLPAPVLRLYLRRSKADEGHQQFSLDVQRDGCRRFSAEELPRRDVSLAWTERVEYVDDDRAGDDFLGRAELRKLRDEVRKGDVVVCRDQSRLGRDALEVTLAIRDLVRERGARLFYYANGQEVEFANAIDAAMAFIQGTGHQMELEAIRSRTREALRARVRAGRIAGGRCYGYSLRRESDSTGRPYTVAVVNDREAAIVHRIFAEYLAGRGLKSIAARLNAERVPSPSAGKRGTGSWAPSCVRGMLRNARYRGIYVHGRKQRIRRGGKRIEVDARPEDVITVDVPEWQIIDDATWGAVQELFETRTREPSPGRGPHTLYALSGLGRCKECGGAIGAMNTKIAQRIGRAYGCTWHHKRGSAVCGTSVRQPIDEVEAALADWIQREMLSPAVRSQVVAELRRELKGQLSATDIDVEVAEHELAAIRSEQRNLAKAVAAGGEAIPELLSEMKRRSERARLLEADLAAAKRSPKMLDQLLARVEDAATRRMDALRQALAERAGSRDAQEVFRSVFPDGLSFVPIEKGRRRIWRLVGIGRLDGFTLDCDPSPSEKPAPEKEVRGNAGGFTLRGDPDGKPGLLHQALREVGGEIAIPRLAA